MSQNNHEQFYISNIFVNFDPLAMIKNRLKRGNQDLKIRMLTFSIALIFEKLHSFKNFKAIGCSAKGCARHSKTWQQKYYHARFQKIIYNIPSTKLQVSIKAATVHSVNHLTILNTHQRICKICFKLCTCAYTFQICKLHGISDL